MFAAEALALAILAAAAAPAVDHYEQTFELATGGEVVATVRAGCAGCAWGEPGREAAALRLSVDGAYSQHLLLARGEAAAEYRITLGTIAAGSHRLSIDRDAALSAKQAGIATIAVDDIHAVADRDAALAQSMAPILYARANTVGKFTDLPILMWYEVAPTPRGRQFRYSVIFTNEDGGTATDRLMATWGRTTDIEYVYGVEIDAAGKVVAEEFQGPGHEVPAFHGRHDARHPLLWVSTDNNMVSESGASTIRYAPAPERFDLTNVSREVVMDRHPWSYALASEEMKREGKIADEGPGHNTIPDPRRFVYIEACGEVGDAALAFAVEVRNAWTASDRGVGEYRIVRDGCFRAAIPLPAGARTSDVQAFRAAAYTRAPSKGQPAVRPKGPVILRRVNTVFMLDERYQPGPPMVQWQGTAAIVVDGPPFDLPIR
jgi:hypothetical protein